MVIKMIDNIDREILRLLQDNGRISNADIARHLGLAPSAVLKRIRRLEEDKVIIGYEARVDRHKVGLGMSCVVKISTGERPGACDVGRKIAAFPEVQDLYFAAGDYYYLAKVKTKDLSEYNEFVKKLGNIGVRDCRTTLLLDTLKESPKLNIRDVDDDE